MKKSYLKSKPVCKVTFKLPKEAANGAKSAKLLGDFTNWEQEPLEMKRLKDGTFTVTAALEKDNEYQFRYLLDEETWVNDGEADRYIPTPFGDGDNCVIVV